MLLPLLFVANLLFPSQPASASKSAAADKPSAADLAKKVEQYLLSAKGVSMSFELGSEGKIKVLADFTGKQIRIESKKTTIVSNGSTIWNYDKVADRITIDNVAKTSSPFTDPAGLARFSSNYTAKIVSSNGKETILELTPNTAIAALLKAAGEAQKLLITVSQKGKNVRIVKASVQSAKGASETTKLIILPVKSIATGSFEIKRGPKTRLLDLRE